RRPVARYPAAPPRAPTAGPAVRACPARQPARRHRRVLAGSSAWRPSSTEDFEPEYTGDSAPPSEDLQDQATTRQKSAILDPIAAATPDRHAGSSNHPAVTRYRHHSARHYRA